MHIEIELSDEIGDSAEEVAKYIESSSNLLGALDLTPDPGDSMLHYVEHAVTKVAVVGSKVEVEYRVDCSAHHACKDVFYEKSFRRKTYGTIHDRVVKFDEYIPPEPRSTCDEF